jgi:hypothetical protein
MRIPTKPPDTARMARARVELARVEARLKRDALKADVIARIVSDTARNKDVLDRPAMFAALTQDADSMMELARQAAWLAEETHANGAEMRRAGTLLGSLLNAFQVPSEQMATAPSRETPMVSSDKPTREGKKPEELAIDPGPMANVSQLPNVIPAGGSSQAIALTQAVPRQDPVAVAINGGGRASLQAPLSLSIQPFRTASPVFFIMLALLGAGFFAWLLF